MQDMDPPHNLSTAMSNPSNGEGPVIHSWFPQFGRLTGSQSNDEEANELTGFNETIGHNIETSAGLRRCTATRHNEPTAVKSLISNEMSEVGIPRRKQGPKARLEFRSTCIL